MVIKRETGSTERQRRGGKGNLRIRKSSGHSSGLKKKKKSDAKRNEDFNSKKYEMTFS